MAGRTPGLQFAGDEHPRAQYLHKQKKPSALFPRHRALTWRRPTLAQPRDALPSALQRFTSVFGMGTGGSTARDHQTSQITDFKTKKPEIDACLAARIYKRTLKIL